MTAIPAVRRVEISIQSRTARALLSERPFLTSAASTIPVVGSTAATSTAMIGSAIGEALTSKNSAARARITTESDGTRIAAAAARRKIVSPGRRVITSASASRNVTPVDSATQPRISTNSTPTAMRNGIVVTMSTAYQVPGRSHGVRVAARATVEPKVAVRQRIGRVSRVVRSSAFANTISA